MRRCRRDSEGGFALLLVFLMAAIVALMLYQQLPRVAFENERDKEQLLIDRGEQYTRAIRLYYLANNRQYPTSIDDLEKREKRFLRRRYVDPFTGKDDWRIVHTNGVFLTDSLVKKPPADTQGQPGGNTINASTNGTNTTTATNEPPQVNAAVLQRPSDRPVTPPGFGQPVPVQDLTGQTQAANTPLPPITLQPQQGSGALPPITLQPGVANQPGGLPPITLVAVGGPQGPGQSISPGLGQPTSVGQTGPGGVPVGIQTGGVAPPGFRINGLGQLVPDSQSLLNNPAIPGQTPGVPGQPTGIAGLVPGVPGQPPGVLGQPPPPPPPVNPFANQAGAGQAGGEQGSPTAALNAINQLLTSPRQTNTAPTSVTGTNQIGAIAGIASTYTGPSIKVYKDETKYELWEFVFDPTASALPGGGAVGPGVGPGGAPGPGGPNQPGGFGGGPGGFGGGPGGFGGTPGGFGAGPGQGTPPQRPNGPGGQQIFGPGR